MNHLHLEGSFRLSYNGSLFVKEGLGYLLTFEHLIDTGSDSGLVFRPLTPKLETKLYLVWKKYQVFTPIAEKLLEKLRERFFNHLTLINMLSEINRHFNFPILHALWHTHMIYHSFHQGILLLSSYRLQ